MESGRAGEIVDARVGSVIGDRYRIGRRIGDSDLGAVYEGSRLADDSRVAVKLLSAPGAVGAEIAARLRLECELLKKLAHPNLVEVVDVGATGDGAPFLVMEYLVGETLAERLARAGRLAPIEALRVAIRVASALSAAHRQGVVHTALRPREIFLARADGDSEHVKVLGFGLGRLTGGSRMLLRAEPSTAIYSAPEQLDPRARVDHRADQFALGVITYEMLTAVNPFDAGSTADVIARLGADQVVPASRLQHGIPDVVDPVLARALQKDPLERYANMSQLGQALENAAAAATVQPKRRPTPSTAPPPVYRVRPGDPVHSHTEPASAEIEALRARLDIAPLSSRASEVERARHLAAAVRDAFAKSELDVAVARGEELFQLALAHQEQPVLEVLRTHFNLLDRIFTARLGPLDHRVGVGPTAHATASLAPAARALLDAAALRPTIQELLDRARMPKRDAVRVVAGLLRRGLLQAEP